MTVNPIETMLDEFYKHMNDPRLKERDRAEVGSHINSVELNNYYLRVKLLYIVITYNWRVALNDAQFQKSKAA